VSRALLTEFKLFVWDGTPHADFEHNLGVQGIRLLLRDGGVQVHHETVAMPEHFPWVLPENAEALDMDDRRRLVEEYLTASEPLKQFYPTGFSISWYY